MHIAIKDANSVGKASVATLLGTAGGSVGGAAVQKPSIQRQREMDQEIEVAGFIATSASDGPGIRSVLFLQGCSRCCPGCHNKSLQTFGEGRRVRCSELVSGLQSICKNKKLTISGGEPLEQAESLLTLLKALENAGFDLCLYTGYETAQVPWELVEHLRYLKAGMFLETAKYPPKVFVGSNNQKFYHVEHRKDGMICLTEI